MANIKTDIVQPFDSNGRLGMIVYSPDDQRRYGESFFSNNMGQGPGAVAWLAGNTVGSGKRDIIQLFDSNGRLGMIVYSSLPEGGYNVSFSSGDMGQGAAAIAWFTGKETVSRRTEIIQLFDSNSRLGMIVYSPDDQGRYSVSFASGDMGHDTDAIAWLSGETTGFGTDIIQLFDSNGRLGMIVYSPVPHPVPVFSRLGYRETFFSNDMGQGPGAIAWLTGDTTGIGKTDLIQLFDSNGRLGMIVYSSLRQGGYDVSFSSGDMGHSTDAIAWLTSNTIGPASSGKADIIQLFDSNSRLGMIVYSSDDQGKYRESFFSSDMGQGPGAIAWLTGQFRPTATSIVESNIIQLFNNNGRLGMIVYSSLPQGGYDVSFSSGDMGHNADAIAWLSEVRFDLTV